MLTPADTRLLQFEETYPRRTGLKTDLIIHDLKLSPARYQQRLRALSHDPNAVAAFPQLCARLQRLTARRNAQREGLLAMLRE